MLKAPLHLPPTSPTMNPVEFVASAFNATSLLGGTNSSTNFVILADPDLQLGHNLRIAEHSVYFAEGDSMQGSHYCSMTGTYILQWKICDILPHVIRNNDLNNSYITSTSALPNYELINTGIHKCKFMYYHELLNSDDFKGSVASLESYSSSFNSLAAARNLSSNLNA